MEQIEASIKVVAVFQDGMMRPHLFNWEDRTYKVTDLHSYYQTKEGRAVIYNWTVSASGNTYALQWNNQTLAWQLVGVDEVPEPQSTQSWRRYQKA